MEPIDIGAFCKPIPTQTCIPRENKDMQRVNQYRFYDLATRVHPLSLIEESHKVKDKIFDLIIARDSLSTALREHPFRVSQPAIRTLIRAIDDIVPRDLRGNFTPKSRQLFSDDTTVVTYSQAYALENAVIDFKAVLSAELQALDTYFISQKGTYSTPDLIEHAENMFPEDIRKDLPDQAVEDIREAGRCLVLDTPTAAGFHILRTIEAVLAKYYNLVTGKPMPTRMRNWGAYLKRLNKSEKVDTKITSFLDHIRESYRNPIAHPEVMLTSNEAEILLGVAKGAILQMILAIQALEKQARSASQINGPDLAGPSDSASSADAETQTPSESPSQTS